MEETLPAVFVKRVLPHSSCWHPSGPVPHRRALSNSCTLALRGRHQHRRSRTLVLGLHRIPNPSRALIPI